MFVIVFDNTADQRKVTKMEENKQVRTEWMMGPWYLVSGVWCLVSGIWCLVGCASKGLGLVPVIDCSES